MNDLLITSHSTMRIIKRRTISGKAKTLPGVRMQS